MSARTANLLGALALVSTDRMRAAAGRELSAAAALAALSTFADGATIDSLRQILGLSHSGGVRTVARLRQQGLVRPERDNQDRRVVRVRLTATGRREAEAILAARRTALIELLAPLESLEDRSLAALLERLLTGVTENPEGATQICRLCELDVCGHPDECPVTQAARAITRNAQRRSDPVRDKTP